MRPILISILLVSVSYPVLSQNFLIDETQEIKSTINSYFNGVKNLMKHS